MTAGPPRLPALRVRLPCEDEKDFYARLADGIAEKGLRVPTANLRPVGTRVRVALEFRDAGTVSGEAIVDAHVEGGARPAMNVRFVRFDRRPDDGGPAHTPAGTPVRSVSAPAAEAPRPAPAEPPAPSPETSFASLLDGEEAAPGGAPRPKAPQPETSFASLLDGEEAAPAGASPGKAAPTGAPPAEKLELLFPDEPARAAEPTPPPFPGSGPARAPSRAAQPPRPGGLPRASRRALLAAAAAAAVGVLGVLGYFVVPRSPPPPVPGTAAPAADGALEAHIGAADRRLADGRLGGADGALEHLLAAKALRPQDPRVAERLSLLADTLETLGARALERRNAAEAEVHLAAAEQAAPGRESIRAKLEALAKIPRTREAGGRRGGGSE